MIKKFENFESTPRKKYPYTSQERYQVNIEIFTKAMAKLKEIMESKFAGKTNPDWGDVGSLSHINEELRDIIEGYDEAFAEELHKLMNPQD